MEIKSARFGEVEISEHSVITFPTGIPGLKDLTRFAIIRCDQTEPIQWLQSMTDETVSIPIINPFIIKPDYEIVVNDEELDLIKTHDEEELVVLNIMVLPEELPKMTVNLMAPLLINIKEMLGIQVLMDYKPMPISYPAFDLLMEYYKKKEADDNAGADKKSE